MTVWETRRDSGAADSHQRVVAWRILEGGAQLGELQGEASPRLLLCRIPRGMVVHEHVLPVDTVTVVTQGEGQVEIKEGQPVHFAVGDVLILRAGIAHTVRADSTQDVLLATTLLAEGGLASS